MSKKKKFLLGLLGLILALVLWDAWIFYVMTPNWNPVWETKSPDERFTVSVYYNPGLLPLPPWLNPRGRAGTVILRENKTGKILKRVVADSVNASMRVPDVDWFPESNSVGVVSIGVWDLPPEEPGK
jgi:hypothetical protein